MLRKSCFSYLESVKTQYLPMLKKSKQFMLNVSYLPFFALLTHYLLFSAIKSKPGG